MNITVFNEMCADLLGFEKTNMGWVDKKRVLSHGAHNTFTDLYFYCDWTWIMTVVDTVEAIALPNDNSVNVTIGPTNYCVIQDAYGDVIEISDLYGKTKKETVVLSLYEFLSWYISLITNGQWSRSLNN